MVITSLYQGHLRHENGEKGAKQSHFQRLNYFAIHNIERKQNRNENRLHYIPPSVNSIQLGKFLQSVAMGMMILEYGN